MPMSCRSRFDTRTRPGTERPRRSVVTGSRSSRLEVRRGACRARRRRPLRARGDRRAAGGGSGRAGGEGGDRRRAARSAGKAARRPGPSPARASAAGAADLVDRVARRPGRHGAARRDGNGHSHVQAAEAQARRRRRPRRRARAGRARRHRPATPGRRQRVVVARRGAGCPSAPRCARRRVLRAATARWRRSRRRAPRAIADPDLRGRGLPRASDVESCARIAHGINIKLAKSGGIREGLRMAHAARALGLGVMLGCMLESGLGNRRRLLRRSALRSRRPRREPAPARGSVPGRRARRRRPGSRDRARPRASSVSSSERRPTAPHPRRGVLARRALRQDDARDHSLRAGPGGRDSGLRPGGGDARRDPDRRRPSKTPSRSSPRSRWSESPRRVGAFLLPGGRS